MCSTSLKKVLVTHLTANSEPDWYLPFNFSFDCLCLKAFFKFIFLLFPKTFYCATFVYWSFTQKLKNSLKINAWFKRFIFKYLSILLALRRSIIESKWSSQINAPKRDYKDRRELALLCELIHSLFGAPCKWTQSNLSFRSFERLKLSINR